MKTLELVFLLISCSVTVIDLGILLFEDWLNRKDAFKDDRAGVIGRSFLVALALSLLVYVMSIVIPISELSRSFI